MRPLLVTLSAALAVLASPVLAGQYHAEVRHCQPTHQHYVKHVLAHGQKVLVDLGQLDGVFGYVVQWESGTVQAVLATKTWTGAKTEFCTIAWRSVAPAQVAELTASVGG